MAANLDMHISEVYCDNNNTYITLKQKENPNYDDDTISEFNDAAFDDAYRLKTTGQVWTGSKMRIVPNLSFGIKF